MNLVLHLHSASIKPRKLQWKRRISRRWDRYFIFRCRHEESNRRGSPLNGPSLRSNGLYESHRGVSGRQLSHSVLDYNLKLPRLVFSHASRCRQWLSFFQGSNCINHSVRSDDFYSSPNPFVFWSHAGRIETRFYCTAVTHVYSLPRASLRSKQFLLLFE